MLTYEKRLHNRRVVWGTISVLLFVTAIVLFILAVVFASVKTASIGGILMAPCIAAIGPCINWESW